MVKEHFMNPRKCLNKREKGNKLIAKLTIVWSSSSIQLPSFILMEPPWWQSHHFSGLSFSPSLAFSNGSHPWVLSLPVWPRLPNTPLPLSILFMHISPPYRLEEQDYWSMGLVPFLCSGVPNGFPISTAQAQAPQHGFQCQCWQQFQQHLPLLTYVHCQLQAKGPQLGPALWYSLSLYLCHSLWPIMAQVPKLVKYWLFKLSWKRIQVYSYDVFSFTCIGNGVKFLQEHWELPATLGSPWRCITREILSVAWVMVESCSKPGFLKDWPH